MSADPSSAALAEGLAGEAAPPRRNGELQFAAPWQSRAFGLAVGLHRRGLFEWEEFRRRLIARIGAWDRAHAAAEPYEYYAHWLAALQDLLVARGLAEAGAIDALARDFAARPPEADHHHEHPHARAHRHPDHDDHRHGP